MAARKALLPLLLIACLVLFTGCLGTKHAPVATPAPVQPKIPVTAPIPPDLAETLAMEETPAGEDTPDPAVQDTPEDSATPFVTETPYEGHPYAKTYTFSGTGGYTQEFRTDTVRAWVFRMNCPGSQGIFSAAIRDEYGDDVAQLADESGGPYAGTKTVQLMAGQYYLDVEADAPWTITMAA